mgnify:CR=1 FL=1
MSKTLVNLTLGEAKTSVNLSLEQKATDTTWADTGDTTWENANRTWAQPGTFSTLEDKTKVNLVLE